MSVSDIEKAVTAVTSNPADYVIKMQKLVAKENKVHDFIRRGEKFWSSDCPSDIFDAHPDSSKSFLYNPDDGV